MDPKDSDSEEETKGGEHNDHDEEIQDLENKATTKKKRLMPKKGDFRMRAHINPLNDTPFPYPLNPDYVDWKLHFPMFYNGTKEENEKLFLNTEEHPLEYGKKLADEYNGYSGAAVDFIDIGCGFGGLLFALSKAFPDKLTFGLEIRDKLVNYVGEKVRACRIEHPGEYNNISVVRTNTMRHLLNYFRKGQISKIFICFADPHFKKKNHRRRIIGQGFLSEYAYVMKPGGLIYSITDVEQLHEWHEENLKAHKQFERVDLESLKDDPCIEFIKTETEEGKKVTRMGWNKYICVFRRVED